MASDKFIKFITDTVESQESKIKHNNTIFEILEGNLLKYLEEALKDQFSDGSSSIAMKRAVPVNVLRKIITKLSTLYNESPKRTTENPSNQEMIAFYEQQGINHHFKDYNENFNAYKYSTMEIYEDDVEKIIDVRSIPSNQFIPFSEDKANPLRVTGIIKILGDYVKACGTRVKKIHVLTDEIFISMTTDGEIFKEETNLTGGLNPFGILPYSYISRSRYQLIPMNDTDVIKMTLNIPVLFTDANYNSMYNAVPIVYGINLDDEELKRAPEVFWNLKPTDPDPQSRAEIGVLKTEMDIEAQIKLIISELSIWLESKNIKPGAIGNIDAQSVASGVAKIIDEADTINDRRAQEQFFKATEKDFWQRLGIIHNTLALAGDRIKEKRLFVDPEDMIVNIDYADPKIIEDESTKIDNVVKKINAGLITKRHGLKELYKDMSDKELDEMLETPKEVIEVNEV